MNSYIMQQPRFARQKSFFAKMNPSLMTFEEEEIIRKQKQRQYKEDLDYLCSFNQRNKQQKEYFQQQLDELLLIKENNINDKQYQRMLLKPFDDYNLQEARKKRNQFIEAKQRSINEGRIASNEDKLQESIEKGKQRQKKICIQTEIEKGYQQHNNIKAKNSHQSYNEKRREQTIFNDNSKVNDNYQLFKNRIDQCNTEIHKRIRDYHEYINHQEQNQIRFAYPFITSDKDLNKLIADQKADEKRALFDKRKEYQFIKEEMRLVQEARNDAKQMKLSRQRSYKEVLDNQAQCNILQRNALADNSRNEPSSIMSGYIFPDKPSPQSKKAFEPLKRDVFLSHDFSS